MSKTFYRINRFSSKALEAAAAPGQDDRRSFWVEGPDGNLGNLYIGGVFIDKRPPPPPRDPDILAALFRAEIVNEAYDLVMARIGAAPDEPDPQTEELERLRAENEEMKEKLAATQLPPNPAEAKPVPDDPIGAAEESVEGGEPVPDPLQDTLARLVPPDADAAAKRAALLNRWTYLNALLLDAARPVKDRKMDHDITIPEREELDQLNAYKGWFS